MKKYFFVGLGLVLALTLLVVAYGAYLNERGESQIALRMEERQAELIGEKAARRAFHPLVKFSAVNLYTASIADAVALTEGRIVEAYALSTAMFTRVICFSGWKMITSPFPSRRLRRAS